MFIVVVLVYASGRGWCVPLQRSRREVPTDRALACGCSTFPGGGVDKVRACLCTLARSWMESACHPDQAPAGVCLTIVDGECLPPRPGTYRCIWI